MKKKKNLDSYYKKKKIQENDRVTHKSPTAMSILKLVGKV